MDGSDFTSGRRAKRKMDRDRLNEVRIIRIMPTGQREKGSQSVFLSGSLKPNEH